jgi:ribonucleotide reductase beta subunit family protein with ferritin-like domain
MTKKTVFNFKPRTKNILFLGDPLGIQRFDKPKYPIFAELARKQLQFIWMPERISLLEDRAKYKNLTDTEKFIFDTNLRVQTLIDSLLMRGLDLLKSCVTNEELENTLSVHSMVETSIHSFSYTHILRSLMEKNMSEFFDSILEDKNITSRAESIVEAYDKLFDPDEKDIKKLILDTIIQNYITEGVLFYTSFVTSFYFGSKLGFKSADIVKEIARDENLHCANFLNIFKILRENPEEGFYEMINNEEFEVKVYSAFQVAVDSEKSWSKYIFSKGDLVGLNEETLNGYIEWIANNRLTSLGYKKIFTQRKNPLGSWINPFFGTDGEGNDVKLQVAPQESNTITSYKLNSINNDVTDDDYESLMLD